jgi:hypothetical protein
VSFPLDAPSELAIERISFTLEPGYELSPLRSGRVIAKDLMPQLWRMQATVAPRREDQLGVLRAWFDMLKSTEAFFGFDPLRAHPLVHPGHTGTANILALPSGNKTLRLESLPPDFVLSPGDYLAFDYGAAPSRALHRVVNTTTADASGETPSGTPIEVRPFIRPGASVGATVHLHKAAACFLVVPGSYSENVGADRIGRISFEAVQTL